MEFGTAFFAKFIAVQATGCIGPKLFAFATSFGKSVVFLNAMFMTFIATPLSSLNDRHCLAAVNAGRQACTIRAKFNAALIALFAFPLV